MSIAFAASPYVTREFPWPSFLVMLLIVVVVVSLITAYMRRNRF